MRFAAAPVGDLRWRAPVEPPRIEGVEKATRLPPICWGLAMDYPKDGVDEDCLFVNVWTPSRATPQSKLPVWVFIGGGGYISLTNANWNGAEVVEKSDQNIVMVNFNYRVGIFGFLASERVRENGDLNVGLLDQRMLLHWVKKHIGEFGGDPDHVVIHGASAGAGSVAMHMIAYGGREDKLFVGAAAESIFFPAQPTVPELEYQFDRALNQTGCQDKSPRSEQISCLRKLPTAALQAANFYQPFPGRPQWPQPLFYWTPCIDGTFITDLPSNLFQRSRFVNVPVLFGTDTDEGSLFAPNADSPSAVATFLGNNYPNLTPNLTTSILAQYSKPLPSLPQHAPYFPIASRAYGEATFICPSLNVLTHLGNSTKRFSYRYNVQDEENIASGVGVPHLFEAAAVFGPDNIGGHAKASYWTYNAPIVPVVMKYWISFVRALDPNVYRENGSPKWKEWDNKGMERLVLETGKSRMESVSEEERERCAFWEGLGEVLEQRR
ncbi:Alpha/Beta hydrolase protein [Cercophora newfieldiana]|uniref:Carboxylic ester hydrolase n=1 Tax=Cercophora newfieldiana TaxID=92897 RepID=A0AA40CYI7_9PEZI|nr:Alpha/Beta hydrolase protein [Cercophora newfieldiana]